MATRLSNKLRNLTFGSSSKTAAAPGAALPEPLLLSVYVSCARNLAPADRHGGADPYVQATFGSVASQQRTKTMYGTRDPQWDTLLQFPIIEPADAPAVLSLQVWDRYRIMRGIRGKGSDGGGGVFLGQNNFLLASALLGEDGTVKLSELDPEVRPRVVLPLQPRVGVQHKDKVCGELVVSVAIVRNAAFDGSDEAVSEALELLASRLRALPQGSIDATVFATATAFKDPPVEGTGAGVTRETSYSPLNTLDDDELADIAPISEAGTPSLGSTGSNGTKSLGLVCIEIVMAADLPYIPNSLRTSFDMDAFVVTTFGRKVFRTNVVRHSLNPVWGQRIFFHVRESQWRLPVQFAIYDYDKMSKNDFIGTASINIADLIDEFTDNVYSGERSHASQLTPHLDMVERIIPVTLTTAAAAAAVTSTTTASTPSLGSKPSVAAEGKPPRLWLNVTFVPYAVLRKKFWLAMAPLYDMDSNKHMSAMEIATMVSAMNGFLRPGTLFKMFGKYGKNPDKDDELTYGELAEGFENYLGTHSSPSSPPPGSTPSVSVSASSSTALPPWLDTAAPSPSLLGELTEDESESIAGIVRDMNAESESLIGLKQCPLCGESLDKDLDDDGRVDYADTITHVAVCSSKDSTTRASSGYTARLTATSYVTADQASRKWFSRAFNRLGYGKYRLGANSGNIIVIDRRTGSPIEERIPTYVHMGIRLLYQSIAARGIVYRRVQKLLQTMSVKQGIQYDQPDSVAQIAPFVKFHGLDMDESLLSVDQFATFNEFFYRKLKPSARPIEKQGDPTVAVSAADARVMVFNTIDDATRLWIKGKQFSVARLLGDEAMGERYEGGSLIIWRLAPQDYHRFHLPVDGVVSEPKNISGQLYTVNPMAIRSTLDVYGENSRVVSYIDSPQFGKVTMVCIGAMMVGSTVLTSQPGVLLQKGDEHGYFQFGGSTIVALFEPRRIKLDADILEHSNESIETLLRMGMSIGTAVTRPSN
ncbi:hypothetical protein GQ42DRAFT_159935 [Ramicandelaber brevisporus]|nr:hypothetical protein GQ42DRAFT_159935 [Ramicandelaber brevisporus]